MTTQTAEFELKLNDGMTATATSAAGALEKLRGRIEADTKELRAMEAAMKRLTSGTVSNVQAVRAMQSRMQAARDSIAGAQSKYIELGGSLGAIGKKTRTVTAHTQSLASTMRGLPGPLGNVVGRFESLSGLLGSGVFAGGLLAIAAAAVAVIAGVGALTVALVRFAIAHGDARRAEALHLEGLIELRRGMGQTIDTANGLQATFDRVARGSALSRDRIASIGEEFYRARLRGDQLSGALQAYSTIEAAVGQAGARPWRARIIAMARAGRAAEANAMAERRFGALARRNALGLTVQMDKLHENLGALFDGIKVEGFLEALHTITDLFSQNTETGRALKTIVDVLVQPLIDQITMGAPLIKQFFKGLVIGALLATIAVLALKNKLTELFGGQTIEGVSAMRVALWGGVAVMGALVLAVVAAAAAIGFLVAGFVAGIAIFAVFPSLVVGAIYGLYRLVRAAVEYDWSALGRSIVDGMIEGVRSSAGRFTQQLRILATDAVHTVMGAFDSHSPSRVFAQIGMTLPQGLAQGVERAAPIAVGAVDDMAASAIPEAAVPSSSTSVSIGGGINVYVSGETSGDPAAIAQAIRDELARVLEGLAIHAGAPA
jgi:hypothetical protein